MGERAHRAYEEAEREAFLQLPRMVRLKANLRAIAIVAALAALAGFIAIGPVWAETVSVKYRGPVDLANFDCTGELDSSVVQRVCYNAPNAYMLIRLKQTWYHYCQIDKGTVDDLLAAPSKGRFYSSRIKDSATGGKFGCRDKPVPQF